MKPEIIIHNSISLDGSLTGFMPDMDRHYSIAGSYNPDVHLIGADTIISGNEIFGEGIPEESNSDFQQPQRDETLPWWVIVDSRGRLKGMLHTCRRFEYCRDVIILISKSTPSDYITHLRKRNYRYIVAGDDKVDIKFGIGLLSETFNIKRILTDTGRVLGNILINLKLVDEISLLIHPVIVGENCYPVLSDVKATLNLKQKKSENYENGCTWLAFKVENSGS
jgi:2,5-diamino-6-(ribosylamino)-4(3H)-pyrimidinone 5'-phosphate reductase